MALQGLSLRIGSAAVQIQRKKNLYLLNVVLKVAGCDATEVYSSHAV